MSLSSFIHSIGEFFNNLFHKLAPEAKAAIHIGVSITEGLKTFVDSPLADFITSVIPGDTDEKIKGLLREWLPKILAELKLTDACGQLTDPAEIVGCASRTLALIGGDFKSDWLDAIAVHLSVIASDGKLDWNDAKYLIKTYYDKHFKPAQAA